MPSTQAIKILVSIELQHVNNYRIVMINITYQKKNHNKNLQHLDTQI
jgi:hypothetical protein